MSKRSRSALVGFLISILPVLFIAFLFLLLILRGSPRSTVKVVEIGKVPYGVEEAPVTAAVLPGSSDVLVFSKRRMTSTALTPIPIPPKSGHGIRVGVPTPVPFTNSMLIYSVNNNATRKLLDVAADCSPAIRDDVKSSFTPDRKFLLVSYVKSGLRQIGLVDMRSGRVLWKTPDFTHTIGVVRPFSDDGKLFVAARGRKNIELWVFNTATGKPVKPITKLLKNTSPLYRNVGFVKGAKRIQYDESLYSSSDRYEYDLATDNCTQVMKLPRGWYYHTPSEKQYISLHNDADPSWSNSYAYEQVVLRDNLGNKIRTLYTSHGTESMFLFAWSPDGRFMAMNHDPDTSRWVIPRPQEKHLFVTIIDAKSGRMIYKYKHNDYNINMVDWYPDSSGVLCLRKEGDEAVVTKLAVK